MKKHAVRAKGSPTPTDIIQRMFKEIFPGIRFITVKQPKKKRAKL